MKKIVLMALAVFAMSFSGAQAQNLLKNGSFEQWESGKNHPAQWRGSFRKEPPTYQKWSDAQDGQNSVRIIFQQKEGMKNENCQFQTVAPLTLQAGEYEYEVFFKGRGDLRYTNLILQVEGKASTKSEDNVRALKGAKKIDDAAWTSYKMTFNVPADGKYYLKMAFNYGSEEVPFLMDNVSLKKK